MKGVKKGFQRRVIRESICNGVYESRSKAKVTVDDRVSPL